LRREAQPYPAYGDSEAAAKAHKPEACDAAANITGARSAAAKGSFAPSQAAVSHIAVSNALLIIGMFIPKFAFAAAFDAGFGLVSALACWATSVARSHDPISWERATEKNRST
jgi:hypothetical protein